MKLSWSHKLFLRINAEVGKRRWLDLFMIFCARWLIYIELILFVLYSFYRTSKYQDGGLSEFRDQMVWSAGIILIAYLISLLIGYIWKRRRPVVDLPNVKTLVHTLGTWKSFPSDHSLMSVLIGCLAFMLAMPLSVIFLFFIMALAVSLSRVYVGVHYPRDIIGGWVLAVGMSGMIYGFLYYAMKIMFDGFLQ